ncbi:MAG: carbohydate-binding domain-containing protein [Gammaproteobacteria bacterium]|nr:carbohydate-binding domain-containing protein [Gammaproteobacteria bacterium]
MRKTMTWLFAAAPLWQFPAGANAAGAPVALRWEPAGAEPGLTVPDGGSAARFILTNRSAQALPAAGWALYFDCEEGVATGDVGSGFSIEQVAGTFYRMHPDAGFAGLAPGQSVTVPFAMLGAAHNRVQAPIGPYFALDAAPPAAAAAIEYTQAPIAADSRTRTPEQTYERNTLIVAVAPESLAPVLPTPRRYQRDTGTLSWRAMPRIVAAARLRTEAATARAMLAPLFSTAGARVRGRADPAARLRLSVAHLSGSAAPEAYELRVDPRGGVSVRGNSAAGVAHGLESLRQLLPLGGAHPGPLVLPALRIDDSPRFAYRGLMLDVARNFQSKATVLRVLDLMARFKLNVFHFHLTDDEGWRLEIPGLPELTSIGARRGHVGATVDCLPPAYGSGPDAGNPFGSGYFSRADYIEILRYAAARHIEVIPELEMPGHARAAVVAMAERARRFEAEGRAAADQYLLNDRADRSEYQSAQHYTDNVMNPALPSTYAFIGHVIAEVAAMHRAAGVPLRTLHMGGDELPSGAWERSPACAALMRREGLADRTAVWDYFYGRVERLLRIHGVRTSGWEELGTVRRRLAGSEQVVPNVHFLGHGYTLYVWRNIEGSEDLAYRLANAGYDTVLTPATRLYLDMTPYPDPAEVGQTWAAYIDLDTVFDFIPFDDIRVAPDAPARLPHMEQLTEAGRRHILGLEAPLFSETLNDPSRLDYMLMPRLLAVAERAWAPDPDWTSQADPARAARQHAEAWSAFVTKLGRDVLPRLDAELPDMHYRLPPPGLKRAGDNVLVNEQIPGLELRYTIDGSQPGAHSPLVNGPIAATGTVRVAAFDRNGRAGRAAQLDSRREPGR